MFDTGQETEKAGYANAFASRSEKVKGGIANIILETKPIFIEEISRKEIPIPAGLAAVTGYAWSDNIGWISFNPSYGGVFYDKKNQASFPVTPGATISAG